MYGKAHWKESDKSGRQHGNPNRSLRQCYLGRFGAVLSDQSSCVCGAMVENSEENRRLQSQKTTHSSNSCKTKMLHLLSIIFDGKKEKKEKKSQQ